MESSIDTISIASRSALGGSDGEPAGTSQMRYSGEIEVTMNFPRTPSFLKMTSSKQKVLYKKLMRILNNSIGMNIHEPELFFECCQTGQIHAHGTIHINHDYKVISVLLSDMAKSYLSCLPKKYSRFYENHIYPEFNKYRSPSLCLKYIDLDNEEDREQSDKWYDYIRKQQL